ncbi:hypothetical protein ACOSQ3_012515 [Xanthoceras sorbifolium]
MSSDSYEFDLSEPDPLVVGSECREEYIIKAKSGWYEENQSSNAWSKEEDFNVFILGLDDIPEPGVGSSTNFVVDRSFRIVVEDYPSEKKHHRRLVTRSAKKPKSSLLVAESISWSLQFGLRLYIQPFYRRLIVDKQMALIQLSLNFLRYVFGCYVL